MAVVEEMLRELDSRREGFSLGQRFYNDPEYYKLDLERIYYRTWLFVGHDCEIPARGQYFTVQIGDYPVIVVRGADGAIRALHNSCRHRGSRVCPEARGTAGRLMCPYHQWTYDLDGTLLRARHMGDSIDKAEFGLKPVHCRAAGGYIFVCLAETAPAFDAFAAQMDEYLGPHRLDGLKLAHESTIVENGNWKLVWENNRECYHCAGNHPELCLTFPEAPTVTGVHGAIANPEIVALWEACAARGLPGRFKLSETGQYRTTRVPLLNGAVSYTMTGHAAVKRALCDDIAPDGIGALLLFHYPTTWNHVLGDHAISFRVLPIDATHTALTTKWLVHKDAVEGVDYTIDELTHVWNATNDQDRRIVEENQFGINSPAYEPGPYAPEHEGGVRQFVDWYCATMQRELRGSGMRRVA